MLDVEFHNVKALYRRAQAYIKTADLDLAKLDIQKALEVDPQNRSESHIYNCAAFSYRLLIEQLNYREVKSLQTTLKQLQLENNKRDAKLYVNMFASTRKDTDVVLKVTLLKSKVGN